MTKENKFIEKAKGSSSTAVLVVKFDFHGTFFISNLTITDFLMLLVLVTITPNFLV